jgi:hypothetical protein
MPVCPPKSGETLVCLFKPTTGLGYLAFSPPSDPVLFFLCAEIPQDNNLVNPAFCVRGMSVVYKEVAKGVDGVVV